MKLTTPEKRLTRHTARLTTVVKASLHNVAYTEITLLPIATAIAGGNLIIIKLLLLN
jgi:hypothetical protein